MATKKRATNAPASKKKPAVVDKKEASRQKREEERQARIAKRAARSAENKATHAANALAAKSVHAEVIGAVKSVGKNSAQILLPTGATKAVQIPGHGRPWLEPRVEWSDELGRALHALVATGHSMREISEMEGMPPLYQQLCWLAEPTHPYVEVRARGKEALVPMYEELANSIAMNPGQGVVKVRKQVVTRDGDIVWVSERRVGDNTERAKLALQGLQWTLGHLKPKKHGRSPDLSGDKPNEQLEGLFAALKAGPADGE